MRRECPAAGWPHLSFSATIQRMARPAAPLAPQLPARYYARLGLLLADLGVPLDRLLRRARIPARRLLDPEGSLSLAEVERLALCARALHPAADLGWRLGAEIGPGEHAALGLALLEAPTLDAALRLAARYFALLSPGFVLRYRPGPEHAEIRVHPRLAFGSAALHLHLDAVLTALLAELEHLLGRPLPRLAIEVAHAAAGDPQRHRLLRRHACRFGLGSAPGFAIRMSTPLLVAALPDRDAGRIERARARLEAARAAALQRGALGDWTRMMLREARDGLPALPELAALCGLSTRSLARHLASEGGGFREILRQVRIERAVAALADPDTRVTRLALELGYSDAANFSRAFRSALGCSPAAFRKTARGQRQQGTAAGGQRHRRSPMLRRD